MGVKSVCSCLVGILCFLVLCGLGKSSCCWRGNQSSHENHYHNSNLRTPLHYTVIFTTAKMSICSEKHVIVVL